MNTTLSTRVDERNYKHPPLSREPALRARHVSLADRAALHVGLALITWSRRPRTVAPVHALADAGLRNEQARERAAREALWAQALYLGQPRR